MKSNTKRVEEEKPREPLPPPAENSDIRREGWWSIGQAAQVALSAIEHNMQQAHAELGAATLKARPTLQAAHKALGEILNVIKLWDDPPQK